MANVLQWNSSTNSFSVSGASSVTPVVGEGIDNNFSVGQSFQNGIAVSGSTSLQAVSGTTGNFTGAVAVDGLNNTNSATLAGASSGSVVSSQTQQGVAKKVVFLVNGYVNDTTTDQSVTYPAAFTQQAAVGINSTGLTVSASLTALTITAPDSTTAYNGVITVEGG